MLDRTRIANFNSALFLRQSTVIPWDYLGTASEWKVFVFKKFFACTVSYIITLGHLSSETLKYCGLHRRIESARRSPVQRLLNEADRCGTTLSRTNGIPPIGLLQSCTNPSQWTYCKILIIGIYIPRKMVFILKQDPALFPLTCGNHVSRAQSHGSKERPLVCINIVGLDRGQTAAVFSTGLPSTGYQLGAH